MPLAFLYWGGAAALTGLGIKFAGDGVEDVGRGARDLAVVGVIGVGLYLLAKHKKVI